MQIIDPGIRAILNEVLGRKPRVERYEPLRFVELESGCWICLSRRPNSTSGPYRGYYTIRVNGIHKYLHRWIYEIHRNGGKELPDKIHVHHTCGNRSCCNPEHLMAVTRAEHHEGHDKGHIEFEGIGKPIRLESQAKLRARFNRA